MRKKFNSPSKLQFNCFRLKKNKHSEDENRQKEQLEKFLKDHNPQIKESTRSKVTTTSATNQPMTSSASVINKDATDTVD